MKNAKKILAYLLSFLMIFTMIPVTAVAADKIAAEQSALAEQGWIGIDSTEEFLKIGADAAYPNTGNYYLTTDLNFEGKEAQYLIDTFKGTLDGFNHKVYGFKIKTSGRDCGMIKTLSGTVKNLQLGKSDAPITADSKIYASDATNFGFLAGMIDGNGAIVENVKIYGEAIKDAENIIKEERLGGFVGYGRTLSFRNCEFIGKISLQGKATNHYMVGGFVAKFEANSLAQFSECKVNAELSSEHTVTVTNQDYVGGLVGNNGTYAMYVDDCDVSGTASGTYAGKLVGFHDSGRTLVVNGCSLNVNVLKGTSAGVAGYKGGEIYSVNVSSDSHEVRNIGDFENGFDAAADYIWLIDSVEDLESIGKADSIKTDYTYPLNGYYRLADNVVIPDTKEYSKSVVDYKFTGIFDGNGKTITGLDINVTDATKGYVGLFKELGAGSAVINLNVGTALDPAKLSSGTNRSGVIAGSATSAIISGVNVYADLTVVDSLSSVTDVDMGGFVGYTSTAVIFTDCNMYGDISSDLKENNTSKRYIGGFVGYSDKKVFFGNCNNFADIDVDIDGAYRIWVGGFVGATYQSNNNQSYFQYLFNCVNFGDVKNTSALTAENSSAAGFIGTASGNLTYGMECANFGNITSLVQANHYANAFAATGNKPASGTFSGTSYYSANLYSFENYGELTGTTNASLTVKKGINCKEITEDLVTTTDGASVRLTADTGLRFTGNVSLDVIDRLARLSADEYTVSYGVLIAPHSFVGDGEFTHEALDAFAKVNNFKDGESPYLEVVKGDDWFKGTKGALAGSITDITTDCYDMDFDGIAYVSVESNGVKLFTLYADTYCTRSIYDVSKLALDDVTDEYGKVDRGFVYDQKLSVGETYYVDGVANTVGEGEKIYSCYNNDKRDILKNIISDYDNLAK